MFYHVQKMYFKKYFSGISSQIKHLIEQTINFRKVVQIVYDDTCLLFNLLVLSCLSHSERVYSAPIQAEYDMLINSAQGVVNTEQKTELMNVQFR
jgi:hypothetical protein